MSEIKKKIDYNRIAGIKPGETWGLNSPKKLHHGLSDSSATQINNLMQQSLNKQVKNNDILSVIKDKNSETERSSGQRAFAKKKAARSHYITKK
jgi:hypothetical protein